MIVKEHLNNLFNQIHIKKPNLLLFEYMDKDLLDVYYSGLYGNRRLSDIGMKDVDIIVDLLISLYAYKWDNTIETYFNTYVNIDKNGYKLTDVVDDVGENTLTRNMLNEISAYNDEEFSNNNQDSETQTGNNTNLKNKETNYSKHLNIRNIKEIMDYLKNEYIHDIIISDINRILTLDIF